MEPRRGSRPLVCFFVGPSLRADKIRARFATVDADLWLLPPAQRGDMLRLLSEHPDVVGIVDGYFFQVPSLLHREILVALEQGIRVLGAASLGALRAAELDSFGMEGFGGIYRWYRDGVIEGDDEVAVAHADASEGFRPLSVSLVSVRDTLRRARRAGVIRTHTAKVVLGSARRIFFAERTYRSILDAPDVQRLVPANELAVVRQILQTESDDIKCADSLLLVETVARRIGDGEPWPPRPAIRTNRTAYLARFEHEHVGHRVDGQHVAESRVLEIYRMLAPAYPRLHLDVSRRCLVLEEAAHRGLSAEADDVMLAGFRHEHDLHSDADWEQWLRLRYLTPADLLSVLRARDLEGKLWEQYCAADPSLAQPDDFARRVVADVAARVGVPDEVLTGPLLMRPGWPWNGPYLRELKIRGQFGVTLRLAGRIAAAALAANHAAGDGGPVNRSTIEAWLAVRWDVKPAYVWQAARERGFGQESQLLHVAREVYQYCQSEDPSRLDELSLLG